MQRIYLGIVAIFLVLHVYLKATDKPASGFKGASSASVDVGQRGEPFTAPGLDGNDIVLERFAAEHRWTVLVFSESWCGSCLLEMPALQSMHDAFKRRGVGFLAVYSSSTPEAMATVAKRTGVTFPMVHDGQGNIAKAYGVEAVPTTFVLDKNLRVLRHNTGGDPGELRQFLTEQFTAGAQP